MWSAKPFLKKLVLSVVVLLAGCTFSPLYDEVTEEKLAHVFVSTIPDREGQILRNKLRFLLEGHGDKCKPAYTLNISLDITQTDLGVNRTGVTTRKNMIVRAKINLIERDTRKVLYSDSIKVENPYVIQQRQFYANPVTEAHVAEQSLELLAHLIKSELAMYFRKYEDKL